MKQDFDPSENSSNQNHPERKKGISRRGFLRGAGLTTAGSVILQSGVFGQDVLDPTETSKLIGPGEVPMQLNVNGIKRTIYIEPRSTLADALRDQLNMTGTKVVCDRGSCSACTIWLNGKPVNSCMTLAIDAQNKEITTIEGIAKNGELHPIQEAFIDHDASMCGFCTPGMVMSAVYLVENNSNPSLDDVKHAIRGNVCRCGTYPKVFDATLAAAKKMKK